MSFVHPAFLWGLLAVAIPVIIHLFQFRRYRTLYFSDTRFIEELQTEQKRQSQLKKLLILALRILVIVAAVMAFAQPYRKQQGGNSQKGSACVLIYIDNSFSMENTATQGSLLNEAKNHAAAIVDAFDESATFLLLTNDMEGRHARFLSPAETKEEISRLQPSPESRQMDQLLDYGISFMEQDKRRNSQVFILSDFQQSTATLSQFPTDSSFLLNLVPLHPNRTGNLYIDSCWFESPVFLRGNECRLHLLLRNNGKDDLDKIPVKLHINGKQKAIANTDIAAEGDAIVEMAFTPDRTGWQQACLEITDYPVTFDDRFYLSFRVQERQPVLCLYDDKENRFLHALFADDSAIRYQTMPLRQMDYSRLPQQNLVILNANDAVSEGCLQELRQYAEKGGCLLVIPSTRAENALSNEIQRALSLPSFTTLDTHRSRVSEIRMEHRLFANTMEKPDEKVLMPAVQRHYRISGELREGREEIITLENGDELLLSCVLGKGSTYMLTVPLEDSFSEFQRHAIFVPALYNMALFKNNPQAPYYKMGGDDPIPIDMEDDPADELPELRNNELDFACIPEVRNSYNSSEIFLHNQIREAGNYLLCNQNDTIQVLSFNYDRKESDLRNWSDDDLKHFCSERKNSRLLTLQNLSAAAISEKIAGNERQNGLFIWLALAFLLAESILLRLWKE